MCQPGLVSHSTYITLSAKLRMEIVHSLFITWYSYSKSAIHADHLPTPYCVPCKCLQLQVQVFAMDIPALALVRWLQPPSQWGQWIYVGNSCRRLLKTGNFCQEILEHLLATIWSWSFPHSVSMPQMSRKKNLIQMSSLIMSAITDSHPCDCEYHLFIPSVNTTSSYIRNFLPQSSTIITYLWSRMI